MGSPRSGPQGSRDTSSTARRQPSPGPPPRSWPALSCSASATP